VRGPLQRARCLEAERLDVGEHRRRIVLPTRRLHVDVQLDLVSIRILDVEAVRHAVVGRARDRDLVLDEPLEGIRERRPRRVPDRDVVKAGRARGGGEPPFDSQVLRPMWWC